VLLLRTTLLLASAVSIAQLQALPSVVRWSIPISARPAAPPVIAGDQVFVVLQSGVVAAQRMTDGAEAWHVELRADQPVAVEGPRVFVAAGEMIHALDAASGSVVWRAPSGAVTAPLLAQNGWLLVASASGLMALRSEDGTKVWSLDTGPQRLRPSIEGDNLYVPLDDGRLLALDLRTGAERWKKHIAGARFSEVLAFSDRVYAGSTDKNFYCFDADNGEWEWHSRLGAVLRGRPAAEGTHLFVTSIDNTLRAYDRNSGALLWHPSVPFRPAAPTVVGSVVVVPGNSTAELLAFDAATGRPAGQIKLEESLVMPPAFGTSGGVVVMAAFTGSLTGQRKLVLTAPPAPPSIPLE
jgi:outer membrane protein assembly factor BamB